MVKNIRPGSSSSGITNLTNVDGTLYFEANDGVHGAEVWRSDGSEAGTALVKDIRPGSSSSQPQELTAVNGILYFSAQDGVHGGELWRSDGSESGTMMVTDLYPGAASAWPEYLTEVNGTLFFRAAGAGSGRELFLTDGTAEGTVMVEDIYPGGYSSWPHNLTEANGILFFAANDGVHSVELWMSDGAGGNTPSDPEPDTMIFGDGITPDDLQVQMRVDYADGSISHMEVAIGLGSDDGVVIQADSANPGATDLTPADLDIKRFVFADGTELSIEDILARADGVVGYEEGTPEDDTLRGSVTSDEIHGLDGNDRIEALNRDDMVDAGSGDDGISLGSGDDHAKGGSGIDVIAGCRGIDHLTGGGENDVYALNREDGQDFIDLTTSGGAVGLDTVSFGVSIAPEDVFGYMDGGSVVLTIPESSDEVRLSFGETDAVPPLRVQFSDPNGQARIYDLQGIVESLRPDLEAANCQNPVALCFEALASVDVTSVDDVRFFPANTEVHGVQPWPCAGGTPAPLRLAA